ncbi:GST-5 protein [Aphelenchoides avenae]|nr:GST-5 protein [Aphelenchus avenae]
MVHYKIVYFDAARRAETARLILTHAGVDFEDVRIPKAEWPGEHKAKAPFGQLPYLEVDGKQLAQSNTINRYLARKFGLAGKDEWEQAWVDAMADWLLDVGPEFAPFIAVCFGFKEGDKDTLRDEVFYPALERFLPRLETFLKESGSGFLVTSGYTWADFLCAEALTTFEKLVPGSVSKNADVWAYKQRVHNIPQIKDYVANRKQDSDF